jgi:CRP-like cAMP-binding protein
MTYSRRTPMPSHSPNQNHLLAALPVAELESLSADLELVPMRLGDMLYEPGKNLQHAYFPTTAIVSLHYITASGESAEITGVGYEGMIGIALFMGGRLTTGSAVVQTGGHGYRLDHRTLSLSFHRGGLLQRALLLYTQALMTQIAQTAACYRHHSVEQQLCRWLLSTADRLPEGELAMTQELVAGLLGVRRESVTEAAGRLRDAGFIRYRRGHISIVDRIGLQTRVCECYGVVKKEIGRLLPPLGREKDLAASPMR